MYVIREVVRCQPGKVGPMVEKIDDFFAMEQKLMASDALRGAMAGDHDVVNAGKREIYRVES